MEQKDLLQTGNYNFNSQHLPNATAVLVLGILSILGAFCYGIGIILGIIGLLISNKDRKLYLTAPELYSPTSYANLKAGRTCSIIGLILSVIIIIFVIVVLIFAFSFAKFK